MQFEATFGTNTKNSPSIFFLNLGASYRLDFHKDVDPEMKLEEKLMKKEERMYKKGAKKAQKADKKRNKKGRRCEASHSQSGGFGRCKLNKTGSCRARNKLWFGAIQ